MEVESRPVAYQGTADKPTNTTPAGTERRLPHAYYALFLVFLANFFNYVDRNIVFITGQSLKTDLHLTDAQLGFLMGTAFVVLYGVVGIAMGRVADSLSRTRLMAVGLAIWSTMTAAAGAATGFGSAAAARICVGIGEATANPCSHSLLSDYFPRRNRAAVLATYLLGVHLGGAVSLFGGGYILQHWGDLCRSMPGDACRLAGWRAVFLIVGAPGLIVAMLIAGLREPPRPPPSNRPRRALRVLAEEMSAAVPPFTLLNLLQAAGKGAVLRNVAFAAALSLAAVALIAWTGDGAQWAAVALGIYSVTTWGRVLKYRNRPLFDHTFGSTPFMYVGAGSALTTCVLGGVQAWGPAFAIRTLGATPGKVGLLLGLTGALAAGLSVIIGGFAADRWRRHDARAPVWMVLIGLVAPLPALFFMISAHSLDTYVASYAVFLFLSMAWSGGIAALIQDLVPTRMRGTAAAAFSMILILVGSGIGPYWTGKISTLTGSLASGLYSLFGFVPIAALLLVLGARRLPRHVAGN